MNTLKLVILLLKAEQETAHHRSQVQGFYNKDRGHHWARDCTRPHGSQIFFQRYDGQRYSGKPATYDESHALMMQALKDYKTALVAEKLLEWVAVYEKASEPVSFLDHPDIKRRAELEERMRVALEGMHPETQINLLLAWIPTDQYEGMLSVNENKS